MVDEGGHDETNRIIKTVRRVQLRKEKWLLKVDIEKKGNNSLHFC